MQNVCVYSEATPEGPVAWDQSQRAETIHSALREYGCECDVPHIPPCVPQPGIPAQPRRSAPCQLDERWKCPHKSGPVYESCRKSCQHSTTTRIPLCLTRTDVVCFELLIKKAVEVPSHQVPSPRPFERIYRF